MLSTDESIKFDYNFRIQKSMSRLFLIPFQNQMTRSVFRFDKLLVAVTQRFSETIHEEHVVECHILILVKLFINALAERNVHAAIKKKTLLSLCNLVH